MTTNDLLSRRSRRMNGRLAATAVGAVLLAGPALAQTEPVATAPASGPAAPMAATPTTPSESMVINLVRLLVKQGVITQDAADALMKQAQAEAEQARMASASAPATPALPPPAPGVTRVPYVPQIVRNQIRDEIKQDVLAQAQAEGWANKNMIPSWVNRIELSGDLRFRDQFAFYSQNNFSPYIDYASFNSKGPTDINNITNPTGLPYLNTRTNRINQFEVLAHVGLKATVFENVSVTVKLATGADNSPQFTGQLLGGDLGKKDIWLDQAFIALTPVTWGAAYFGRMPNPFLRTDLVFDDYTNLEGVALSLNHEVGSPSMKIFGSAGAFPMDYVANNFPTNSGSKEGDHSKWLYGAQVGAVYQPDPSSWSAKAAVSYYTYQNIKGQLSSPCVLYDGNTQCDTDWSRPAFMQKGNTLFLIRDIVPNPSSPLNYAQPQYLGLLYGYNLLDVNVALDHPIFDNIALQLKADYVRNLSYDPKAALANPATQPVNNYDLCLQSGSNDCVGPYHSGNNAWMIRAMIGDLLPKSRGAWNLAVGYKYIEPDAVLDAFNDPNFHFGGTNAKGYFIVANYYFANNAWVSARWYSANEVYGPPLAIDLLQLELGTRF